MIGIDTTFASIMARTPNGSTMAPRIDAVFGAELLVSLIVVAALAVTIVAFLVRYRRGSRVPRPPLGIATWKIETGWIVATTAVFLAFFLAGAGIYLDLERAPANAVEIDIVGRQWMWDVRHANGRREFDTLHVPVGQPVRLRMTSEDVIHSFFVPAFRIKQDVVPGKFVSMWFEATRPGTYHLFCSQFCGTKHAGMTGEVIVQSPEDYSAWLASGSHNDALADRGRRLFLVYGCSGCHTPGATVRAPPLEGLYGKLVPLEGGTFVRVDEAYLRDSMLEPSRQIAAGYQPLMPSFKGVIPEGDLIELVTYLKSLGADAPAPMPTPVAPQP